MNVEEVADRAEWLFNSGLYCAESVLQAVAEHSGVSSPLIPRIATGFCSGLARTKGLCGAVSGGVMALSIIFGRDNTEVSVDATYEKIREFLKAFNEQYGSDNCFILTGCDLGTEEGRTKFKDSGMRDRCHEMVGDAARMAAGIISRQRS